MSTPPAEILAPARVPDHDDRVIIGAGSDAHRVQDRDIAVAQSSIMDRLLPLPH